MLISPNANCLISGKVGLSVMIRT